MRAESIRWNKSQGWSTLAADLRDAQIALIFASRSELESADCVRDLQQALPQAKIIGCSTGGLITGDDFIDDGAGALVLRFTRTRVKLAMEILEGPSDSRAAGERLGHALAEDDLKSIFVLSDGLAANGSRLIEGIRNSVADDVIITGGLAGDGSAFERTVVVADGSAAPGRIVAVGFYGSAIRIGHGCAGGWDHFGPIRIVTSAEGSTLRSLDNQPALALYKQYLGEEAAGLPGSALLFPLLITDPSNKEHAVVRTVLSVDHEQNTMTFAGDIPQGWSAQLMRGRFHSLSEGAAEAARAAMSGDINEDSDVAAVMVSCVGRRLLMGESVIDEIDAAAAELGSRTVRAGFYSYGEISPHARTGISELHNQTMTITTFSEAR